MRESLEKLQAPTEVRAALDRLCDQLASVAGANLVGIILYGGLARGRFNAGRSDINVVVVLRDAGVPSLRAIAPVLHAAWRAWRVEPFLLTPGEIAGAAADFPTKFMDIQRHRVVLAGEDPFAGLTVPRENVRLRIEQELRNLGLRLRRRYLAIAHQPVEQAEALAGIARPLALGLASLLDFAGKEVPAEDRTTAIFDAAAAAFGLEREALAKLAQLRQHPETQVDATALYGKVLEAVGRSVAAVAEMKESRP